MRRNPFRSNRQYGSEANRNKSRQFGEGARDNLLEGSKKYFLDDLSGAQIPASMITRIIDQLDQSVSLSVPQLSYLRKENLVALFKYATNEISKEIFELEALQEQEIRLESVKQEKIKQQTIDAENQRLQEAEQAQRDEERKVREKQEAARRSKLEQDPKFIAQKRNRALVEKYEITTFVKSNHFVRLVDILNKLDIEQRLIEEDEAWLNSEGEDYYNKNVKSKFHAIEAEFYVKEFSLTQDIWKAISASGHLRKCDSSQRADQFLGGIKAIDQEKDKKLRSAFYTTHGGVKRDIEQHKTAISYAEKAHLLTPDNFRPCTLLGAVYMETYQCELGHEWYGKAEQRGYRKDDVDRDLRRIFMKLETSKRRDMLNNLIKIDKERYQFLLDFL